MAARLTDTNNPGSLPILNQALQDINNLKTQVAALQEAPAFTNYVPQITSFSGTFTTTQGRGRYKQFNGLVFLEVDITFTTAGSGNFPIISLPVSSNGRLYILAGMDSGITGDAWTGQVPWTTNATMLLRRFDATGAVSNGSRLIISGFYEAIL